MTQMPQPEDKDFQDLLSDYISPVDDKGFSESVLTSIKNEVSRRRKIKFIFLAVGAFVGGVISATQWPYVLTLFQYFEFPGEFPALITTALLFAFIVWTTLDIRVEG